MSCRRFISGKCTLTRVLEVFGYLMRMGIEPRYVLQKIWSAPPTGMTNVDGEDYDLCRANITTWIQRGCSNRDYGYR